MSVLGWLIWSPMRAWSPGPYMCDHTAYSFFEIRHTAYSGHWIWLVGIFTYLAYSPNFKQQQRYLDDVNTAAVVFE